MRTKLLSIPLIVFLSCLLFTACPCDPWWILEKKLNPVDISGQVSVKVSDEKESHLRNEHVSISVEYCLNPDEYEYDEQFFGEELTLNVKKLNSQNEYENYYDFSCYRIEQENSLLSVSKDCFCIRLKLEEWDRTKKQGSFDIAFPEQGEYLISYELWVPLAYENPKSDGGECKGEMKVSVSNGVYDGVNFVDAELSTDKDTFNENEKIPVKMLLSNSQIPFDTASMDIHVYKKDSWYYDECNDFYFSADENPEAYKSHHMISTGVIDDSDFDLKNILSFIPLSKGNYLLEVSITANKGEQFYETCRSFFINVIE